MGEIRLDKIYFITDKKYIKIGTTSRPSFKSRLRALQTGHPLKLELIGMMLGGKRMEECLHRKFKKFRVSGEWFKYTAEIKRFIDTFCVTNENQIQKLEIIEEKELPPEPKKEIPPKLKIILDEHTLLLNKITTGVNTALAIAREAQDDLYVANRDGVFDGMFIHWWNNVRKRNRILIQDLLGCDCRLADHLLHNSKLYAESSIIIEDYLTREIPTLREVWKLKNPGHY